jgi:hypothetical protein
MASDSTPQDRGYDPGSRRVRRCIDELRAAGFELVFTRAIGLSGIFGFSPPRKRVSIRSWAKRDTEGASTTFAFVCPTPGATGNGRASHTTRPCRSFADHEGFRCGTCHPYRPFDLERNREIDLWEVPLVVMDGTLRQYRRLGPDEAVTRIVELADRCREVEGVFTLLWHNSSLEGEWAGWGEAYERAVGALASVASDWAPPPASQTAAPGGATRCTRVTPRESVTSVQRGVVRKDSA